LHPSCISPAYCDADIIGTGKCLCPIGYTLNLTTNLHCDPIICSSGFYGIQCDKQYCPDNFICDDQNGIFSTGQCYLNPCENNGNYIIRNGNCTCDYKHIGSFCDILACAMGLLNQTTLKCDCFNNFTGEFCDIYTITERLANLQIRDIPFQHKINTRQRGTDGNRTQINILASAET